MWYVAIIIVMTTRNVFVLATVVSIRDKFCYPCCTRCHKKVHTREEEIFWCEGCREEYNTESVQYRYRISVAASDRTQLAQITVFGSCLDRFFGISATSFMRFVKSVKSDAFSAMPWSRVVYQAMEQCFVGTLLQFGFRIYSPCGRTASQISRNSPFHLKNVVNKQLRSEKTSCRPEQFPSLLACQILPCSSNDQQSPTVLQILNEYLQELHRSTPQSFNPRSSQRSLDGLQSQASYEPCSATRHASLQGERVSSIYCTPQEFGSMITPLVLTGSSQPSSASVPTQGIVLGSNTNAEKKLDYPYLTDNGDPSSFPIDNINSKNSNSSGVIQSLSTGILKSGNQNTDFTEDCPEQHLSQKWEEYDDFPSSEDLSAFLADLERDALNKEVSYPDPSQRGRGRSGYEIFPTLHSEKGNGPLTSVTSDAMTSEVVTLKEVVCEMSQTSNTEDYTEFTEFPSSEDLDAFLADMELDCENKPMGKSLTIKSTAASASVLNRKLYGEVEGSRTLAGDDRIIEDIVDKENNKPSSESRGDYAATEEAVCDMQFGSDSYCAQQDARPLSSVNCSSMSDQMVLDNDCSDLQFLRDCESVFAELTENICNENETKRSRHLLQSLVLSNQRRSIPQYCREGINGNSTRQNKPFCRSGSTEEFHEKIVCNTPLRDKQTSIIRSRDRNANKTDEGLQGDQIIAKRWTSIDHHGNNDVSMLNDSCDMMACAAFSPDLFSRSLSPMEEGCSKTPDLFSSSRLGSVESRSHRTQHSGTPDLFSSPTDHTHPSMREELNSISLFSSYDYSTASSPSTRAARRASLPSPAVSGNEAASLPNVGHCDAGNEFDRNSLTVSSHSTPCCVCIPSKILNKAWTPIQVSPLLSSSGSNRCSNDISLQGTPILFSQMSNSSL